MNNAYLKHRQKVIDLMHEAQLLDIDHYQLFDYKRQVDTAHTQSLCTHTPEADKQRVHNGEVILWKCNKCKKVVDVETV